MGLDRVNVALVGLGFGSEFIPIYQNHPLGRIQAICQRNVDKLKKTGDQFGIATRYTKFEEVLADKSVDFVHINSPIPDHAPMSIAALKAGKHVMCTVPMATTVEECQQIVELVKKSGNKFAVESCHIKIKDSDIAAHIWRFLYDTARQYRESFDVYGTKKSFEWTLVEHEEHIVHTAKKPEPEIPSRVKVPDYAHLLPEPIRRFTQPAEILDAQHLSFLQGGGHGGSHPHLANEFLSAMVQDRDPWPNAVQSAN